MLSLFSVPKPFVGKTAVIQHNAIASWARLQPTCEIVLLGNDPGVAEAAMRHGVRHEPTLAVNQLGTPLLDAVFGQMNAVARSPILGFVNADIILLNDFISSVRMVARLNERFLLVSSRYNRRIDGPLLFESGWDSVLRGQVRHENRMYPAGGSDLFVFPRGLFASVPNFSVGRGYWDNWLMREARRMRVSLIDATAALTAIHQEHSYQHIPGIPADSGDKPVYESEEGQLNLALAGGQRHLYTVFDASEVLTENGQLLSTWRPPFARRRVKASLRRIVRTLTNPPLPRLGKRERKK
jgi:hypothetical protein